MRASSERASIARSRGRRHRGGGDRSLLLAAGQPGRGPPITGMVRQTEIRIAPETTGRLATVAVQPGQHVRKGDLLAVLDNPELAASLGEAKAAAASAKAERDRVYSGVRAEEVAIADAGRARRREANLCSPSSRMTAPRRSRPRDFASRQKLDESTASLAKAKADLDLKRAQAGAGAAPARRPRSARSPMPGWRWPRRRSADLQAQLDKTRLIAPADGTIGIRVAEPGEIIGPGKPVMTLDVDGQRWFAFTLREDDLDGLTVGSDRRARRPQDGRRIDGAVTELRPLGEFATWRAARAVGDHDLNAFRVRLDPTGER